MPSSGLLTLLLAWCMLPHSLVCYSAKQYPVELAFTLMQAYSSMDNIARLALAAICRSCHVRLRSDTFAGILDDSPMLRGVVSSSSLHAMQHINNFLLRDQLGDKWTMAMSQDGLKSKGFMTVIAAKDTRQGAVPHVCKLQVAQPSIPLCLCNCVTENNDHVRTLST